MLESIVESVPAHHGLVSRVASVVSDGYEAVSRHVDLKWATLGASYNAWSILLSNTEMMDSEPERLSLTIAGRVLVSYVVGGLFLRNITDCLVARARNHTEAQLYGNGGTSLIWGAAEYFIYAFVSKLENPLAPTVLDIGIGFSVMTPKCYESYEQLKAKRAVLPGALEK
jgi:hypothetical protein